MVTKRVLLSIAFFVVTQFLLFVVIFVRYPLKMEKYLFTQSEMDSQKRYGDLFDREVHFNNDIRIPQGFNRIEWSHDPAASIEKLRSGEIVAYVSYVDSLETIRTRHPGFKIVGRNVHSKGTAFLLRDDTPCSLEDKPGSIFYYYMTWLGNVITGKMGENDTIRDDLVEQLPKTIFLVIYSIVISLLIGICLAYFIAIFLSKHSRAIENLFELFSSFPDFVIAFLILYVFFYKLGIISGYVEVFRGFEPGKLAESIPRSVFYFFFPALTIAISNGNISYLLKILLEKINDIKNSPSFAYLELNGMKRRYLYFVFILKEIMPITFGYISQKIPLYIGAAIIVEWMFDIKGIGYTIIVKFKDFDVGVILIYLSLLYLLSIVFDVVADTISSFFYPKEYRKNV